MTFESDFVTEDWRSYVIVPLFKVKGERNKCKNYKAIRLLSLVGKYVQGS